MAPAAARPLTVYQTAAHNVLAATVGEISPAPTFRARSFRDRVYSPFGRLIARLLIKLLIVTPLPRELQLMAAMYPVSILWTLVPDSSTEDDAKKPGESAEPSVPPSASEAMRSAENVDPIRAAIFFSMTNPDEPELLSAVAVDEFPVEMVIHDGKAYLGINSSADKAAHTNVFSLAGVLTGAAPQFLGAIQNVGGKIWVADGLIYGSNYSKFGAADSSFGLNGVRTATLGQTAIVNTDPARVVVSEKSHFSAEKFKLKYRAVPTGIEITGPSKIEFLLPNDEKIGEMAAPLVLEGDKKGTGELDLPLGFTFPRKDGVMARPRLVINAGTDEQIVGLPKNWNLSPVAVRIAPRVPDLDIARAAEHITADFPQADLALVSDEWFTRFEKTPPGEQAALQAVTWEPRGQSPADMHPGVSLIREGVFQAFAQATGQAGQVRDVLAKVGNIVVATSEPFLVEPGAAAQLELTADRTTVPADRWTEVLLTVVAKDAAGNVVADGTAVTWEAATNTDGEFLEPQLAIQGGKATTKYRAGGGPGQKIIRVYVDDVVKEITIQQAPLRINFVNIPASRSFHDRTAFEILVQVSSDGGEIKDGTPISWFASYGQMVPVTAEVRDDETIGVVRGGEARARWDFSPLPYRPRVDFVVAVGVSQTSHRMAWTKAPVPTQVSSLNPLAVLAQVAPAPRPIVSVAPSMIAGDLTADATMPFELPDGTTEQVPVKATATYQVTGLTPGEHVRVRLGTNRNPNLLPIAHYRADEHVGTTAVDSTGFHDGQITGGVSVDVDGYHGQAFRFDGTGFITIPHHQEFEVAGGFMVQAAAKVPSSSADQVLIEKAGEYRLSVVDVDGQLRARLAISTAAGEQSVTSTAPVSPDTWTLVTARYEVGRLSIGVDSSSNFIALTETPSTAGSPIVAGAGFVGSLDEVRFFDLQSAPMLTFADGAQEISFVADGSGTYETSIVSSGQLASSQRLARYHRLLEGEMAGPAQDGGAVTERLGGGYFAEIQTFHEDSGEESTDAIGIVSWGVLAFFARFAQGVFVGTGSGQDMDFAVVAGDIAALLYPRTRQFAMTREFINAVDRVRAMQSNEFDALTLTAGALVIMKFLGNRNPMYTKLAALAKVLPAVRQSRATGALARVLALEAKFAASGRTVSRIQTLVDLAGASIAAKVAVGIAIDFVGAREQDVVHLNNVLENAENTEEVLDELKAQAFTSDMPAEAMRMNLGAFGIPLDQQAPAAVIQPARWVRLSRALLQDVRTARIVLVNAVLAARAHTLTSLLRKYHKPDDLVEIYRILRRLQVKLTNQQIEEHFVQKGNMYRLLRDLTDARPNKRNAALHVLRGLNRIADEATDIAVEVRRTIPSATGEQVSFADAMYKVGGQQHWAEWKFWDWSQWKGFPPVRPSSVGNPGTFPWTLAQWQWNSLREAEEQFAKVLVKLGPDAATNFKVFWNKVPAHLANAGVEKSLRDHFLKLLTDPYLKRKMVRFGRAEQTADLLRYEETVRRVRTAINNMIDFQ